MSQNSHNQSSHPETPEKPRAGAQEVAERAGVSVMTVSRVFSGSASVAEKTRQRVLEAARALDYQPNIAARALRTGRAETIGFLLQSPGALLGHFHSQALAAFESVLSKHDLSVLISIAPEGESYRRWAHDLLRSGRCGGLVVQSDEISERQLTALRKIDAPMVLMNFRPDASPEDFGLTTVGYDNRGGTEQVVRHLTALGHRRIAFISGTPTHHDAIRREEAFIAVTCSMGLDVPVDWIRSGDFSRAFECGAAETEYLISEQGNGPTAVICASDEIAMGALQCARRCGIEVPRDLSIVGFDNLRASAYTAPPLTTVEHSGFDLGLLVAELLINQIENPRTPPTKHVLETRLIVRESTAQPHPDRNH
jgi:DNA-binding LacI/PurR family transcriptional regulator